ncbi:MAG: hypothetical protein JNL56_13680 [Alphaproteobacteria bacterium]|nr:hypothetical protein [Alphaproteobacteria bacterium]
MFKRRALAVALAALAFPGVTLASGGFAGDDSVFSGVAGLSGEGLIVPQTLVAGGMFGFDHRFEANGLGQMALVTTAGGGTLAEGLGAFPLAGNDAMDIKTRLTAGDMFWGLTPYVGVNVTAESDEGRVFQGTTTLLPYQGDSLALQGVAGIAYELMPGVGAGLEYRYQGYAAATPVAADASSNQTIMMRLDLGLN